MDIGLDVFFGLRHNQDFPFEFWSAIEFQCINRVFPDTFVNLNFSSLMLKFPFRECEYHQVILKLQELCLTMALHRQA